MAKGSEKNLSRNPADLEYDYKDNRIWSQTWILVLAQLITNYMSLSNLTSISLSVLTNTMGKILFTLENFGRVRKIT